MSDTTQSSTDPTAAAPPVPVAPAAAWPSPAPPYGAPLAQAALPGATSGPVGQVRGTGACIGLCIVTFGIYALVWYYKVHSELKAHTGAGIGGGVALLLALFVGIAMPFVTSSEVGGLYRRAGREEPVTGRTGLWYFPGSLILVGPIVWFVKTNGALNEYWKSQGAAA